jgi:type II secretory pathway component PulJ
MHSLQNFNYNGQIIQRRSDGFVSLTQMCASNGKRMDNWMRLKQTQEYIKVLEQSLQNKVVDTNEGGDHSGTWGHPKLAEYLSYWLSTGSSRKTSKFFELSHQEKLCEAVGGTMEVPVKTGRIDILSPTEIIEVKDIRQWKSAVGQVLIYQLEFPSHQARVHLYGKASTEYMAMIVAYCSRLNVIATFEDR